MVQKSGVHQLRLVVYPSIFKGAIHPWWLALGFLNHQQNRTAFPGALGPTTARKSLRVAPISNAVTPGGMEVVAWKMTI